MRGAPYRVVSHLKWGWRPSNALHAAPERLASRLSDGSAFSHRGTSRRSGLRWTGHRQDIRRRGRIDASAGAPCRIWHHSSLGHRQIIGTADLIRLVGKTAMAALAPSTNLRRGAGSWGGRQWWVGPPCPGIAPSRGVGHTGNSGDGGRHSAHSAGGCRLYWGNQQPRGTRRTSAGRVHRGYGDVGERGAAIDSDGKSSRARCVCDPRIRG